MTVAEAKPKSTRRWFQFSLATVGISVALLCLPLSWLAYERSKVRKRLGTIAAIKRLGGEVAFDETLPFRPRRLSLLLGDDTPGEVVKVSFNGTQVTDASLAPLAGCTGLKDLSLYDTGITDAGLAHLSGLSNLKWLWLDETQITDAGLAHLAGLAQLEFLLLNNTQISDAGLAHLAGLTKLQVLSLENTPVTDAGVAKLQKALPNVLVKR